MKMEIKKRLSVVGLSLLLALGVSGCSEGDLKIKVVNGNKTIQDVAIFIDDEKVGSSQGGFSTFKVSEGEHTIRLENKNEKYDITTIYTKKIEVADGSVIESILNVNTLKPTIKMNKKRKESIANIFKKYNLVGEWYYNINRYNKKVIAISEKGEWGEWTSSYSKNKKFTMHSIIKDDGEGLVLVDNWQSIKFNYPVIVDDCFKFIPRRKNSKSYMMCKKY